MTSVYWASEGAFVEFSNSLLFLRGTCALDPRLPLEDRAHSCLEEARPRQSWYWEAGFPLKFSVTLLSLKTQDKRLLSCLLTHQSWPSLQFLPAPLSLYLSQVLLAGMLHPLLYLQLRDWAGLFLPQLTCSYII